jgi:uncharacterized protein involved in oxidation of intracellular sulfur
VSDPSIEKNLYIATCAGDNPEKAAIPFVMANAALAMDVQANVCLQGNGVYLALKGYTETMVSPGGFPPMTKLIHDFIELGGKLLVCAPCIKERHMDEDKDLIDGAAITAGGALNLLAMECKAVFVY